MPSPVPSNCDARHHCKRAVRCCLVNGTHTTGLRAYSLPPPQTSGNSFSGDLLFLRQQETDLPPAELWCACSFC
ncbi:hypothetical protein TNCV_924421 [Trichonephila clavipes]|nr:hypothetical protein TNCV_924421 [Trichonephila clavipes]